MTATTAALRLAIVDDSQVVRMGLKALLASERGIALVGEAGKVAEAVDMAATVRPDIVLLDIRLPDGSGFDACRRILQDNPQTRILFLTSVIDDQLINDAIRCGGHGYLLKEVGADDLVQAIFDVAAGKSVLDPQATARVLQLMRHRGSVSDDPVSSLSPQERRVLSLIAEGKTNKEVGNELGLTEKTVKNYLANIFGKLSVTRRSQAVALFVTANNTGSSN
jgi:two-component system response regulator DevR